MAEVRLITLLRHLLQRYSNHLDRLTNNVGSLQTIALFVLPYLVPKILALYRSIRNRPVAQLKPLPRATSYALAVLFASATIALLSTFPLFAPENIFQTAHSRLQTPGSVLLRRLEKVRPLTPNDEALKALLDAGGVEARQLYARFGPRVLLDCPFSSPGELEAKINHFYYAVPALLTPHILHLFALGVATSGSFCGRAGVEWRTLAISACVLLALGELGFLGWYYDDTRNIAAIKGTGADDFICWKLLVWRGVAIAAIDGLLGWVIWLSATGRAFIKSPTPVERVLEHTLLMDRVLGKAKGLGVVRNGAQRNAELKGVGERYWGRDAEVMESIFAEQEVVDAQRAALGRVDMGRVEREAEGFVGGILGQVSITRRG